MIAWVMPMQWSSRLSFILVATGASVGIGNIWKFPYMVGANGGSAFVLVYVLCIVFIAIPLLIAELHIGRRAAMGPPTAIRFSVEKDQVSPAWQALGWLFLVTGFLILSFFSVVSGWILDYLLRALGEGFAGASPVSTARDFSALLQSPLRMTGAHLLFMSINIVVVSLGLRAGIERVAKFLMPSLFLLLVCLTLYSFRYGAADQALNFLFHFQPAAINSEVVLMAAGQAFLSIGLCSGMMMICGAYLPASVSIPRTAVVIATTDTLVALLAGLMIFPLVFAYELQAAQGPGLIFETLPIAFGAIPFGPVVGPAFFLLLLFASITSSVALLEMVVAWICDRFAVTRLRASLLAGAVAWLLGLLSVLSFNLLAGWTPLGFLPGFEEKGMFDTMDYIATNLLLVGGGFLLAVFSGWFLGRGTLLEEVAFHRPRLARCWHFCLRYLCPLSLGLVILGKLHQLG